MKKYDIGMVGEEEVAKYLEKIGCNILYRNYRTNKGEIDIIFEEGENLVFGEVKTRTNELFGKPCESVDKVKRNKIIYVAKQFIYRNVAYDKEVRFDVFEVNYNEKKINHIRDAYFEEEPVL